MVSSSPPDITTVSASPISSPLTSMDPFGFSMSPATDAAELESSDSLNELRSAEVTIAPDVDATGIGMESWGGKGKGGALPLWRASEGIDLRDRSEGVPGRVAVGVTCPCRE